MMKYPHATDRLALRQFMLCYFNQNYDMTYGTFEACLDAFMTSEPKALQVSLLPEMEAANDAGCILDIMPHTSPEWSFWHDLGGMRLVPRHLQIARRRLARD